MKHRAWWVGFIAHPWVLVSFLILLGVAVRFVQYTSDRPLWADEAMLTINILNRSYRELFTPLDYEQQAPVGFLFVEKWLTTVFGTEETTLRLFPFLASMASLVLMAIASMELLPFGFALLAILLFVFSAPLIYYASEVKPYALDLTVGLLLTLLSLRLFRTEGRKRRYLMVFLFGIGAVGLWFSQAIVFILASIGIIGMIESLARRDRRAFFLWTGASLGWLMNFLLQSFFTLGQYYARYREVWQEHYAPFPPFSLVDLSWYMQSVPEVIRRPGGISLWPIALVSFCVGAWYLWRHERRLFFLLLLPGFLALVASMAHFYPFTGRFLLFFTPAMFLCIALGFWRLFARALARPWISARVISVVMVIALGLNAINIGVYRLQHPQRFEVITPLIRYYLANREPGDTLYLYYGAAFAFDYYAKRFGIDRDEYIKGVERSSVLSVYTRDLEQLDGTPRVWVLFSHIYNWGSIDEEAFFVGELERLGVREDEMHTDGASLYLYDLR